MKKTSWGKKIVSSWSISNSKGSFPFLFFDKFMQIDKTKKPCSSEVSSWIFNLKPKFNPLFWFSCFNFSVWSQLFPYIHKHTFMLFWLTTIWSFSQDLYTVYFVLPTVKNIQSSIYSKFGVLVSYIFDRA